ncbi:MAG: four helix bundle protein [Runella sp.]
MNRLKELKVWHKAIDLVVDVYEQTSQFPTNEKYGLVSQINRAVVSIPSNIEEGAGRNNKKEFNSFLGIAAGSTYELQTQIIIAYKVGYVEATVLEQLEAQIIEIQKMIYNLQKTLCN